MSRKLKLALPLALGALVGLVMASAALATHPKPNGAAKVRVTLVPSMKECTTPNTKHGTPLAFDSCNPPVQQSSELTVPNDDSTVANGSITVRYFCTNGVLGDPLCGAAGDQADVRIIAASNDVRCKPIHAAVTSCGSANTSPGNDYTGNLLGTAIIRITDHFNGAPGFTSSATVIDTDFPVGVSCTGTSTDLTRGSGCPITTSADAVVPDVVKEDKRASIEIEQLQVLDAGEIDGILGTGPGGACPPSCVGTGDESTFAVQGIFIP